MIIMTKRIITWMLAAIFILCGTMNVQAQAMKAADLEKYAKSKYGDKWLDAAANLASELTLDKNESLTYQQVIDAPGKTKQQRQDRSSALRRAVGDSQALSLRGERRSEAYLLEGSRDDTCLLQCHHRQGGRSHQERNHWC